MVESVEGGEVEVVVMDVRDEDGVDSAERERIDGSLAPQMEDPPAQHGIGDEEEAVELDPGAAMPQPRQRCGPGATPPPYSPFHPL